MNAGRYKMILEFLNLIIILGILVAIMLWLRKIINKKNNVMGRRSKNIVVVDEGLSISVGQRLSIIKVGEEHFLMTHGQNGVGFQALIKNDFQETEEKWENELKSNQLGTKNSASKIINAFKQKKGGADEQ
jgi:flagellar biogenesis protein FliO